MTKECFTEKHFEIQGASMLEIFFLDPFLQTQQSALFPRGGLSLGPHPQRITAAVFPSAVTSARVYLSRCFGLTLESKISLPRKFFIFFRGDCHLISVGPWVPNLTQQCPSAGCIVYVWKSKTLCSVKARKPVPPKTLVQSRAQDCTQPSLITQNKS